MAEPLRIFVVHALAASLAPVAQAFSDGWPKAMLCNLMDDALSRDRQSGRFSERDFQRRFIDLVRYCQACGADGVLFACSAFNAAIESARRGISVPVLKPDEAMIGQALDMGDSFAVVATFEPSIDSLRSQIEAHAGSRGRAVRVEGVFVEDAMGALNDGDGARHDALIARAVGELSGVDAVLLAQFSMARAAVAAAPRSPGPLLTSPASAVARLRSLVIDG
ncbi:MAG TPA: aspartate/glutamate racemase family protein [Gammaproteobacteria bacterium]|nr:aspartate/glutamate racemase family protein [Gammaproteobacteria bacterium]